MFKNAPFPLFKVILLVVAVLTDTCRSGATHHLKERCTKEIYQSKTLITIAQMNFALELLRHSSPVDEMSLLSPFAIASALSTLYSGAGGGTEHELGVVLSTGQSKYSLETYMESVIKNIQNQSNRSDLTLRNSNKILVPKNFLQPDFEEMVGRKYGYELKEIVTAGNIFNDLRRENKDFGVGDIVITFADKLLILINNIQSTADWQYEFQSLKYLESFSVSPEQKIDIPMMVRTAKFPYYEDEEVQVVSLPLKISEMQMLIILPKQESGLKEVENELTGEKLYIYVDGLKVSNDVKVKIPKFKFQKEQTLAVGLKEIGVKSIFSQSADLSGISNQHSIVFKDITNQAHIKISEKGINNANSNNPVDDDELNVDGEELDANHPFLYAIISNGETILLMGRFVPKDGKMIVKNRKILLKAVE